MQLQQTATFNKTISILNALAGQGAKYCIQLPDGSTYGNLTIPAAEPAKKKVFSKLRKHGEVSRFLKPYIDPMQPGDVVLVPDPMMPDLDGNRLQSCIAARCALLWGKGTYTALKCDAGIEVMRIK